MRLVAGEAARSLGKFDADPELGPIIAAADRLRREQGDLIASGSPDGEDSEATATRLTRLSLERDRVERDASRLLAERGVVAQPLEAQALAGALRPGEAAIGYRRLAYAHLSEWDGILYVGEDHLFAHILRADKTLTRVDLGSASELEELAHDWRAALGAPLLRGMALAPEQQGENLETSAGTALRRRILDPVLTAAGEGAQRLFICADDLVFLIPLDALPLDDQGSERLGDRVQFVSEVSFARLLAKDEPAPSAPSLLAMGGVDYDAEGAVAKGYVAVAPPVGEDDDDVNEVGTSESRGSRSPMPSRFGKLLQSRFEVEAASDLFEEAFAVEPTLLTRKETTKAALFAAAGGKRYVHLATHGWFAPGSVNSTANRDRWAASSLP